MYEDINVLVLDEPTNHLDIESLDVLEEALQNFPGTILAVSHDRFFVNQFFERVCWLENERLQSYLGNYEDAIKQRRLTENTVDMNRRQSLNKQKETKPKALLAVSRNTAHEEELIEQRINEVELQLKNLGSEMYRTDVVRTLEELAKLTEEYEELECARDGMYDELAALQPENK